MTAQIEDDRDNKALLAQGVFDFAEPVGTLEDFAWLGAVGGADDAVALHQIDEVGGAAVADAQTPLQKRGRSLAVFQHDAHGVLIKLVVIAVS